MRFRGRLRAPGDTGPGLPVAVFLDDDGLTLESNGERIGSWSLSEVSATRTASDRFEMGFGDEHLLFEAEDTLGFSYEALPFIDGRRSRSQMDATNSHPLRSTARGLPDGGPADPRIVAGAHPLAGRTRCCRSRGHRCRGGRQE